MSEQFQVWNVFLFDGACPVTCKKQGVLDMLEAELEIDGAGNTLDEFRVVPLGSMTQEQFDALPEWEGP